MRDAEGNLVDSLTFSTEAPWPQSPDGYSPSLERICPAARSDLPQNWAASPRTENDSAPGGTPGARNATYSEFLPPIIDSVTATPMIAKPGQPIAMAAKVYGDIPVRAVTLTWQTLGRNASAEENTLPMSLGDNHIYTATIPGQKESQLLRCQIHATNEKDAERVFPAEHELRPAISCLSQTLAKPGGIPLAYLIRARQSPADRDDRQPERIDAQSQMRQIALTQFRAFYNLSILWGDLTLKTSTLENAGPLRAVFAARCVERDQLEKQTQTATNFVEAVRSIPSEAQAFKKALAEAIRPQLNEEQAKILDAWRTTGPRGGIFNRLPGSLAQQLVSIEDDYLFLSSQADLTDVQFDNLRGIFREAVQARSALTEGAENAMNANAVMSLQAKSGVIRAKINEKLRGTLTTKQMRAYTQRQPGGAPNSRPDGAPRRSTSQGEPAAFVYVDPKTQVAQLFDFAKLTRRHGGYKVHFCKDQMLNGMPVVNLSFKEESDRWSLTEPLSYELHRRAGEDVCRMDYARLYVDGSLNGYSLFFEQPNGAFFRRLGIPDGVLYKSNYRGSGLEQQNVKKSKTGGGHEDLAALVGELEDTKNNPKAQWEIIRREFDAEKLASHYAVRMILSDWDGFFNNYYLYHDTCATKKWTFYVWDQDKTWGDYDGYPDSEILYNMPLSFGAEGDRPAGWQGPPPQGFRQPGMNLWWRPGGWISKPVLANAVFRRHFLARIKDLLNQEFTEERLDPLIDQLRERLLPEVRLRAEMNHMNGASAEARFKGDLATLKEFVKKRRAWLLAQPEIQRAGAFDPTQLK